MVNNVGGQFNRPTESNALDLLIMCVGMVVKNGCIVLDAIDECADVEELLFDMKLLLKNTGIKILYFSRPNLKCLYDIHSPKTSYRD